MICVVIHNKETSFLTTHLYFCLCKDSCLKMRSPSHFLPFTSNEVKMRLKRWWSWHGSKGKKRRNEWWVHSFLPLNLQVMSSSSSWFVSLLMLISLTSRFSLPLSLQLPLLLFIVIRSHVKTSHEVSHHLLWRRSYATHSVQNRVGSNTGKRHQRRSRQEIFATKTCEQINHRMYE